MKQGRVQTQKKAHRKSENEQQDKTSGRTKGVRNNTDGFFLMDGRHFYVRYCRMNANRNHFQYILSPICILKTQGKGEAAQNSYTLVICQ